MKPTFAVHKFTSCDGCQLALLTAGEELLQLSELVEIKHFVEAGYIDDVMQQWNFSQSADQNESQSSQITSKEVNENTNTTAKIIDIALVEGSISTPEEVQRILKIRASTRFLITIGACATAGGIQALRNTHDLANWKNSIYPHPEFVSALKTSKAIKEYVHVDEEIWGCPVSTTQVLRVIRQLLFGVLPYQKNESVCMECKQKNYRCVLVSENQPCLGAVTRSGCGALCPSVGSSCYGCYGPSEMVNGTALAERFFSDGWEELNIIQRFNFITSQAKSFQETVVKLKDKNKNHGKEKKN